MKFSDFLIRSAFLGTLLMFLLGALHEHFPGVPPLGLWESICFATAVLVFLSSLVGGIEQERLEAADKYHERFIEKQKKAERKAAKEKREKRAKAQQEARDQAVAATNGRP